MKTISIQINSDKEMIEFGKKLAYAMYPQLVLALNGDLGAGKTTFTKGIGLSLGIKRVINSPTFTIMKIYNAENKINGIDKLYHLDVYRITNENDDFELEEYFHLGGVSIVEWADIIKDLLPKSTWKMNITITSPTSRNVVLNVLDEDIDNVLQAINGGTYEIIY